MNRIIDLNQHVNRTHLGGSTPPVRLETIRQENGSDIPFARVIVRTDTNEPLSVVGKDYELVPHSHLIETVETAINRIGLSDDDVPRGIFFTRRGAKMRALFKFPTIERTVAPNDKLCPVIRIVNSYDRTTRITIEIGAFRFACTNFSIGGGFFSAGFNAIHQGEIDVTRVQGELEHFLTRFDSITETFSRWLDTPWSAEVAESMTPAFDRFGRKHLSQIPALADPPSVPNFYRAYNNFTFFGTHRMRTANAAFRFLDATNQAFQTAQLISPFSTALAQEDAMPATDLPLHVSPDTHERERNIP